MELELKHLAPYLPYELKVLSKYNEVSEIDRINWSLDGHLRTTLNLRISQKPATFRGSNINTVKPILRPLSDLTKEIEHNRSNIVPIVDILKIAYPPPEDIDSIYGTIDMSSDGHPKAYYRYQANHRIIVNTDNLDDEPYWIIQKLFEWHFDVLGLIDAGLAISVHDLPENPYK